MPLYEKTPQKHHPGCWRWSNHWRCAVDLVNELADILEEIQDDFVLQLAAQPGLISRIEALLTQARAMPTPGTMLLGHQLFSFGKRR